MVCRWVARALTVRGAMDVWDRIQDALTTKALDPKEFETCALALLGDIYPGLSPVEGGHDFGRDGDIYLVPRPLSLLEHSDAH